MEKSIRKSIIVIIIIIITTLCSCMPKSEIDIVTTDVIDDPAYMNLSFETLYVYLSYYFPGLYDDEKLNLCYQELSEVCENGINTKVKMQAYPEIRYDHEIRKVIDSGQPMDIFIAVHGMTYGKYGDRPIDKWLELDAVADITDLVGTYHPSGRINIEKYEDRISQDGKIYGIPIVFDRKGTYGLWIPKDLGRNVDEINSFEDISRIIDLAIENDKTIFIQIRDLYNLWAADQGFYLYETYCIDSKENKVYPIENLDMTSIFEAYQKYLNYEKSIKKMNEIDNDTRRADLQICSYDQSKTFDLEGGYYLKSGNIYQKDLRFINIPATFRDYERCRGAILISGTSQNKERSLIFLDFVSKSEKASKILLYGKEGATYSTNEDGYITYSHVGLWGNSIANMEYDNIHYHFEVDDKLYENVRENKSIGMYRDFKSVGSAIINNLSYQEEDILALRSFVFFGSKSVSLQQLYTQYTLEDIVVALRDYNNCHLEDSIIEYLTGE